jgi:hypothetical protein
LDSEPFEKLYAKKHQTLDVGKSCRQIEFPTSTPKNPSKKSISINDFEVG